MVGAVFSNDISKDEYLFMGKKPIPFYPTRLALYIFRSCQILYTKGNEFFKSPLAMLAAHVSGRSVRDAARIVVTP